MKLGHTYLERASWAVGLWAALAVGGCIVEVDFDPVGSDASVEGSWTIDGATPTQANCDALGISNVRVRFYDGSLTVDPASLVFSCADGSFDTRPSAVLADGQYAMELLAVDASGTVVAEGGRETFDTLVEGGHIQMSPVNFVPAVSPTQVTATWTIDGATPTAANCAELGIVNVGIDFMDSTAPSTIACETGSIAVDIQAGSYNVQVRAYNSDGDSIAMAMAEAFTVAEGAAHALNGGTAIPFEGSGPTGTDAALDASWTIGGTTNTPSAEVCEIAGGTLVEFVLYDAADTARANGTTVAMAPCADGSFTSTGSILRAGSYLVSVFYRDAAMALVGSIVFNDTITLAAGDTLDLTDVDLRLEHTTLSFALSWQPKGGVIADATDCTTAGVTDMLWDLYLGSTPTYASDSEMDPCEASFTFSAATSEPVGVGSYQLRVEASDGVNAKTWSNLSGGNTCEATIAAEGDLVIKTCSIPLGT